ncbi:MAG: hypothetical protein HKN68_20965 [Saprospiraceae bacterium]|nr:hypothetical protein [Saprospiraceae bacterium]
MKEGSYNITELLKIEGIWWLITAVIVLLLMAPIYTGLGIDYPFYASNIAFIVIFITFTRYMFLLRYTFFSHITWIKVVLIFLPIPMFFYFMDSLYDFQRFLDEDGLISIMGGMSVDQQYGLAKYIRYEKLFFGTGAMVTIIMLPIRMIVSIWRVRNRGTV